MATAEPTVGPAAVDVVCDPAVVHGEEHETEPFDSDRDGVADECAVSDDSGAVEPRPLTSTDMVWRLMAYPINHL